MYDIKIGDYLTCKIDYFFNNTKNPTFFKNKTYKVEDVLGFISIFTDVDDHDETYIINGYKISWYLLPIIFYTKKEERKYKLLKIK